MTETIEIEVPNETVALEVGYSIMGRAYDIHSSEGHEEIAEELNKHAWNIIQEYE